MMDYLIVFMMGFVIGAVVFRRTAIMITAFVFGGMALYYYVKYAAMSGAI
jgi:hypothetical protein